MDREDNSKNPLLAAYRDDPYHEGGSFESSHIPLRGQVPLEDDTPPAYTDAPSRSELQQRQVEFERPTSQTPPDESQDYNILYSKVTKNSKGSTITVISPLLTTDPKSLRSFIADERRLAPNPVIRIEGYHTETRRRDKKDETVNITDFDISISASDLFISHWRRTQVIENGIKAYRGGRTRSVAPGFKADLESTHTAPSLEEWYHRFCASGASLKT